MMSEIERDLPELSNESVLRIERAVMDDIGRERQTARTRAKKRRGWVGAGLAAAAVVAGAIVIVPVVQQNGLSGAYDSASGGAAEQAAPESADAEAAVETERQVIRTGTASIVVDDVQAATDALSDLADEHGGYVEGLGSSGDEDSGDAGYGWITLRIPADDLDAVRASLAELGDVEREEVSSEDVTGQSVDLEARIDSLQASVDRLGELMAKAGSVGDLLQAEQALSERQAELESLQREYDRLGDQVAMSTLSVDLTRSASANVDPNGFGDGLVAGWNALVGFLGGLIVVIGAVLPWVGAVGVVAFVVWLIVRLVHRRHKRAVRRPE